MSQTLAKIAMSMLAKLVSEKFLSHLVVYGVRALANSTPNKLDDLLTSSLAEALGVVE